MQMATHVIKQHKDEFDRIHLESQDSDGEEYVSELLREKPKSDSCCS